MRSCERAYLNGNRTNTREMGPGLSVFIFLSACKVMLTELELRVLTAYVIQVTR